MQHMQGLWKPVSFVNHARVAIHLSSWSKALMILDLKVQQHRSKPHSQLQLIIHDKINFE